MNIKKSSGPYKLADIKNLMLDSDIQQAAESGKHRKGHKSQKHARHQRHASHHHDGESHDELRINPTGHAERKLRSPAESTGNLMKSYKDK